MFFFSHAQARGRAEFGGLTDHFSRQVNTTHAAPCQKTFGHVPVRQIRREILGFRFRPKRARPSTSHPPSNRKENLHFRIVSQSKENNNREFKKKKIPPRLHRHPHCRPSIRRAQCGSLAADTPVRLLVPPTLKQRANGIGGKWLLPVS